MIVNGKKLNNILKDHSIWILTKGRSGKLAELIGRNLDGANLEMANLPFADMQSASLKGAYLQGSNFRKAKLKGVNLRGARLDGADFEGADLSGADLSFAICKGTSFVNSNLSDSKFVKADLSDANLEGANLQGAAFNSAKISNSSLSEAELENDTFERAHLNETNFSREFFPAAKENGPKLSEADFTYQDLDKLLSESSINIKPKREEMLVNSIVIDQAMLEEALRGLIDRIKSNISDDQVKAIFQEQYGIEKIDRIDFESGNVVAKNEQVSFKLDFQVSCTMSLLIDRGGKCTVSSADDTMMHSSAEEATDDAVITTS